MTSLSLDHLRDRLLFALTEEAARGGPPAAILAMEPGAALLGGVGPLPLWIILQRRGEGPAVLEARVRGAGQAVRSGPVAVAVLSDEPELPGWLQQIAPLVEPKVAALYGLELEGVRTHSGSPLSALEKAVERAFHSPDFPSPEDMPAALVARRQLLIRDAVEQASFSERLSARRPLVTFTLMGVCALLFLLQMYWGSGEPGLSSGRMGAGSGERVFAGEWWRLLTPAFLHGNLAHIAMNMMALYALGPTLESLLGRSRFLVLYFLGALGASLTTALLNPGVSSVGASGAVWALMGAMLGLALRPNGLLPESVVQRLRKSMWTPILINVGISFLPGIDMWGHFGGGLVGLGLMLSGSLTGDLRRRRRGGEVSNRPLVFAGLGALLALAASASIATALTQGRPWTLREAPSFESVALEGTELMVSVPRSLSPASRQPEGNGLVVRVLGDLSFDPAVVQLSAAPGRGHTVEALAEELRREMPSAPVEIRSLNGRPVAVSEAKQNGFPIETALTMVDDWELAVIVVRRPGLEAWEGLAARIASTATTTK